MYSYKLKRFANCRTIRLRISGGQIVVSAPCFIPKFAIDNFVNSQADWLAAHLHSASKKIPNLQAWQVFGKSYQLCFAYFPDLASGWQLVGKQLIYNSSQYALKPKKSQFLTASEKQAWQRFAKKTLAAYINRRLVTLHQQMGIKKPLKRISLKNQRSCWGSCSSLGNLNFNLNLIHFDPQVIDYVLIHELAHLVYLNHSAKFWALVGKHDGNYQLHRQLLNKFSCA